MDEWKHKSLLHLNSALEVAVFIVLAFSQKQSNPHIHTFLSSDSNIYWFVTGFFIEFF